MELKDLTGLVSDMFERKARLAEIEKDKKAVTAELKEMKAVAMVALAENEMKSFSTGGLMIINVEKKSVRILDKNLLLNWLDERGELRDALTVSVATATKIYNEEYEAAQENKNMEFLIKGIPGLSAPETFSTISLKGNIK